MAVWIDVPSSSVPSVKCSIFPTSREDAGEREEGASGVPPGGFASAAPLPPPPPLLPLLLAAPDGSALTEGVDATAGGSDVRATLLALASSSGAADLFIVVVAAAWRASNSFWRPCRRRPKTARKTVSRALAGSESEECSSLVSAAVSSLWSAPPVRRTTTGEKRRTRSCLSLSPTVAAFLKAGGAPCRTSCTRWWFDPFSRPRARGGERRILRIGHHAPGGERRPSRPRPPARGGLPLQVPL